MTSKYLKAFRDGSLLTVLVVVSPAHADPLAGYRGKNRLLVVVAETPQNESAAIQRQIYQRARKGMTDRDVVLVEAIGNDERALAIRARLAVSDRRFRVLLVGKDGNTAASSEMPFTTDDVFGRIDAMPMRKDEVRRQAR